MPKVVHIIGAIIVFDVTVVVVVPAYWPFLVVPKPVAAIVEAVIPADHLGTPHVEPVAVTEMGTVIDVRNATIKAAVIAVAEQVERDVNAGMSPVVHIIVAISVLNINVIIVVPACWPCLIVPERIAAVLEAVIPTDRLRAPHVEGVSLAEMGTVIGVGNAAILATAVATVTVVAAVVSNGLLLPPTGLLSLLGALWLGLALGLLGALWLRLVLCLLSALWLRLVLCLLGALRLRLALSLLGALWLRLVLCLLGALWLGLALSLLGALWLGLALSLLGALWLRLVLRLRSALWLRLLRRLRFSPALFLLGFLCERRNGSCEK